MARHQKLRSDDMHGGPWVNMAPQSTEPQSSCVTSPINPSSGGQLFSRSVKASMDSANSRLPGTASPGGTLKPLGSYKEGSGCLDEPFHTTVHEQAFTYKGVKVRVKSTPNILSWKPAAGSSSCCVELPTRRRKLPYDEILGVWQVPHTRSCDIGLCPCEYSLVVYAVGRKKGQPCKWHLEEHRLVAGSPEQAEDWIAIINASLQMCHDRPKNLLVLINPFSGAKRSRVVWEQKARPVFEKAHIKYTLVETLHADHARDFVANMKPDELAQYQGVVAVGGDGVFQECVMGLMEQRALGGSHLAAASRIRVGHIPGGSTDAVACSLHGTRCAETAALHVALGDRLSLDVANITCRPSAQEAQGTEAEAAAAAAMPPHSGPQMPAAGKADRRRDKREGEEELLRHSTSTGGSDAEEHTMMGGMGHKQNSSSTPAAAAKGSDFRGGAQGATDGKAGKGEAGQGQGNDVGGGPEGVMGRKDRLKSRHFMCQAAYGFLGDVMCLSEGLRFMGPARYDFAGFLQLVKLQSYRLQILYKPSAQSLRADAQDVCSYKCEVCRLAGLSMLDQAQGSCEPPSSGTPTKSGPDSAAPRPPLPPSLYVPPAPANPRAGQSPFAKGARSPIPSRHGSSPGTTCINNPSYQASPLGASLSSSPTSVPKHLQHHNSPFLSASTGGKANNAVDALTRGGSDAGPRGSSSWATWAFPASSAGSMGQAGLERKGNVSPVDGLLSGPEGGSNRGLDGNSPAGVSLSDNSASALLGEDRGHEGRGGGLSAAQRLLEQSGVSSSNARTGCCEGGMHRLHEHPDSGPLTESGWVATVGEYVSVMAVATPCRSDMTKRGIVPNAHLSDGRIYLILVSKCNRLDYLRFLIRLSSKGLEDNCFPFVKIIPVTSVIINPLPPPPTSPLYANLLARCCPPPADLHICSGESAWNVDGELLPHNAVRIGIMRGAVEVFARGVELVAPSL
uniref:DAGKc domain-containing protein n=1 Tax=Dunaliella tertiolecta TaxID=3047 RepID=A0A7S3QT80_DUNTE